jgi:hypothetical protein
MSTRPPGRRRSLVVFAAVLGLTPGTACRRQATVATALEVAGIAERASGGGAWSAAPAGTAFAIGDTLRTGAASRARLALVGGGVIRVGENARLRFQRGALVGQQAPDIAVDLGAAEVEGPASEMSIVTVLGPARVERGARVRVRADGQTTSLEVVVGRAVMVESGQEVAVDAGHGVRIHIGSPEIQRFALRVGEAVVEGEGTGPGTAGGPPADAGSAARATAANEATDAAGAAGAAEPPPAAKPPSSDQGPRAARAEIGRADITLTAGESATVHDGRPPAAVRLRTNAVCPHGEAIVELGGHGRRHERFTGTEAVVVRLKSGSTAYNVRCAGDGARAKPRASGVLSLRRDTGDVPLARRAPLDVIDADGRHYTVLFQTRLPLLTLAWPAAPRDAGLELHLASADGERVVEGASPRRPLPSGTLREGTYTFWYRTADGKQSPKTSVSVRFDNAAPTAQFFRAPPGAGNGSPRAIAVDGVTVDGAKVSVGGQPIAVDGHGRFRFEAAPLAGDEAVAVRLEHPRTGVHYYVRRRSQAR